MKRTIPIAAWWKKIQLVKSTPKSHHHFTWSFYGDFYLFTHIFLHVRDILDSPPDSCSTVLSDSILRVIYVLEAIENTYYAILANQTKVFKKRCGPCSMKKVVKSKVAAQKWNLYDINSGELILCCLLQPEISTKILLNCCYKNFAIIRPPLPLLGRHRWFHNFFHATFFAFCMSRTFFLQFDCFV